jgi:elongation factor Ts
MVTTIEMIKKLREETGAGVTDCRQALEQSNSNYNLALIFLQEQAAEQARKRIDRPVSQGMIEVYSHANGRIGVIVEVNCETDFAARSQAFRTFTHEIALQIAAASPMWVCEQEIPMETLHNETEKVSERVRAEGKPETLLRQIVAGYMKKFMNKNVLMRQISIRDELVSVGQLLTKVMASVGENIVIRRFERWELEEGNLGE